MNECMNECTEINKDKINNKKLQAPNQSKKKKEAKNNQTTATASTAQTNNLNK